MDQEWRMLQTGGPLSARVCFRITDDGWYSGVLSDESSEIEQIQGSSMGTTDLISEQFGPFNSLESPLSEKWEDRYP